jgi:DDE superfamily endonuclease
VDMKALRIAHSATVALGLQDEIRRSEESRCDHRLHGVLLVAQGVTCPDVAGLLGEAPRSVENWMPRFVVITDNIRYRHARLHRGWREEHADRFVLDYLPPYSPDLNPIERIWKLTRRQGLHNRYFPMLGRIVDSVETQFKRWLLGNITLHRLCAITQDTVFR